MINGAVKASDRGGEGGEDTRARSKAEVREIRVKAPATWAARRRRRQLERRPGGLRLSKETPMAPWSWAEDVPPMGQRLRPKK
jgi:hypothetical protein